MFIDPNTGGVFFQVLALAATATATLVFSWHIRSGLARVRRPITRPSDGIRIRRRSRN